jgi:predicted  nucleic acid-binding Zn-ribbon protein
MSEEKSSNGHNDDKSDHSFMSDMEKRFEDREFQRTWDTYKDLKQDMRDMEKRTSDNQDKMFDKLFKAIDAVDNKVGKAIDKIDAGDNKLNDKINALDNKVSDKIDALDKKVFINTTVGVALIALLVVIEPTFKDYVVPFLKIAK